MKAVEFITEAFDQPYPIEWEKWADGEAVDALATLDDGTNLSIMFRKEGTAFLCSDWMVEFQRNNSQEITGEGDAQRVFATVLKAIRQFVKKYKANTITFSASKDPKPEMVRVQGARANPESSANLYDSLIRRYASAMGYSAQQREGNGKVTYLLRRLKPGVAEGEDLTEIAAIPAYEFVGGKAELGQADYRNPEKLTPLPGGSGFAYSIENNTIIIVDTKRNAKQAIAYLDLAAVGIPISGRPLQVQSITVDEDYRGQGLAKALYGIVLAIMKRPLVSGTSQTPGGRRNWLSLASIPGVEVKGLVRLPNRDTDTSIGDPKSGYNKYVEKTIDRVMELGGQLVGKNKSASYWTFDVEPGNGRLEPVVQNALSKLYGGGTDNALIATWTGK
jgi:predicted GNAT family acetyltransferase